MSVPDDDRRLLLQAAAWQDSLLLSYRALQTGVQLTLLATAALVAGLGRPGLSPWIVAALFVLHLCTAAALKQLVIARAKDVDWWHRRLLAAEAELADPARRHFTAFKQQQKGLAEGGPADPQALIEKAVGHTRRVVDHRLLLAIRLAWIAPLAVAGWPLLRGLLGFAS